MIILRDSIFFIGKMHKVSIKYVYLHRNKICPIKKQEKNGIDFRNQDSLLKLKNQKIESGA